MRAHFKPLQGIAETDISFLYLCCNERLKFVTLWARVPSFILCSKSMIILMWLWVQIPHEAKVCITLMLQQKHELLNQISCIYADNWSTSPVLLSHYIFLQEYTSFCLFHILWNYEVNYVISYIRIKCSATKFRLCPCVCILNYFVNVSIFMLSVLLVSHFWLVLQ